MFACTYGHFGFLYMCVIICGICRQVLMFLVLFVQLIVEPVVECREDKDEVWGEFGCEIFDRKLAHMVGELRAGHKFKKTGVGTQ